MMQVRQLIKKFPALNCCKKFQLIESRFFQLLQISLCLFFLQIALLFLVLHVIVKVIEINLLFFNQIKGTVELHCSVLNINLSNFILKSSCLEIFQKKLGKYTSFFLNYCTFLILYNFLMSWTILLMYQFSSVICIRNNKIKINKLLCSVRDFFFNEQNINIAFSFTNCDMYQLNDILHKNNYNTISFSIQPLLLR